MAVLMQTVSVRVSSIQIMKVRVQNKGKSVRKSRYDGDVSVRLLDGDGLVEIYHVIELVLLGFDP